MDLRRCVGVRSARVKPRVAEWISERTGNEELQPPHGMHRPELGVAQRERAAAPGLGAEKRRRKKDSRGEGYGETEDRSRRGEHSHRLRSRLPGEPDERGEDAQERAVEEQERIARRAQHRPERCRQGELLPKGPRGTRDLANPARGPGDPGRGQELLPVPPHRRRVPADRPDQPRDERALAPATARSRERVAPRAGDDRMKRPGRKEAGAEREEREREVQRVERAVDRARNRGSAE